MEYYTEEEARNLVIKAGKRLVEEKLIARTWGNISARISEQKFVITPSGRGYESLKPEELVIVDIFDCSYDGNIKPSSEKAVHAAAYLIRPNVKFVIHTHQFYASAVCAEEKDTFFAPCAKYGKAGSMELAEKIKSSIYHHPDKKAFLMAKHGAVCLGKDYEEAFDVTEKLEEKCKKLFEHRARTNANNLPWLDDYAQLFDQNGNPNLGEDPEAIELVREKNRAASCYVRTALPISPLLAFSEHRMYTKSYSKLKETNK